VHRENAPASPGTAAGSTPVECGAKLHQTRRASQLKRPSPGDLPHSRLVYLARPGIAWQRSSGNCDFMPHKRRRALPGGGPAAGGKGTAS